MIASNYLLKCSNLNKAFSTARGKTEVLRGIGFTIRAGTINLVTGPSGAGKTTLLGLLAGLERPDTGRIFFRDTALHSSSNERLAALRRREIGIIFQNFNLLPTLNAVENVEAAVLHSKIIKKERIERAEAMLHELSVFAVRHHRPAELSEGQQQRVAVARALINTPTLILADEPTAQIDRETADSLIAILRKEVSRGSTLIVATHGLYPRNGADQVLQLHNGRIR